MHLRIQIVSPRLQIVSPRLQIVSSSSPTHTIHFPYPPQVLPLYLGSSTLDIQNLAIAEQLTVGPDHVRMTAQGILHLFHVASELASSSSTISTPPSMRSHNHGPATMSLYQIHTSQTQIPRPSNSHIYRLITTPSPSREVPNPSLRLSQAVHLPRQLDILYPTSHILYPTSYILNLAPTFLTHIPHPPPTSPTHILHPHRPQTTP